jgi:trehalose utilization protein
MYGEPFGVPEPLETVFVSWFQGGEVFRSGLTYRRGAGNIFYFRPGHETYPTYHEPMVQKVIANAVRWAFNPEARLPNRPMRRTPPSARRWNRSSNAGPRLHHDGEEGYR